MIGKFVCFNGNLINIEEAKISIDNIEFSYGFGVYENIRLRNNKVYFLKEHLERLLHSAQLIGLEHNFNNDQIVKWLNGLIVENKVESANVKMLLIGGKKIDFVNRFLPLDKGRSGGVESLSTAPALRVRPSLSKEGNRLQGNLYIMQLAPIYPEDKIYRDGVKVTSYKYERFLPGAKTLNMLPSYLAYAKAKEVGAYDTLFIDKRGNALEGTRSNLFVIKKKRIYTTPVKKVLDGVTRRTVIDCAKQNGYKVIERNIKLNSILKYDGAFLTNTSGKIVPVREVESYKVHKVIKFEKVCEEIRKLIKLYNEYLDKV